MKSEGFLHSKVARRIFLLFIACAMLPIVALSLVSSVFVTRQLENQSRERLHQMAKSAGMDLFRTIENAGNELKLAAAYIEQGKEARSLTEQRGAAANMILGFRSLELVSAGGARLPLVGDLGAPPVTVRDLQARIAGNEVQLSSRVGEDGVHRAHLGVLVGRGTTDERLLIGEIHPEVFRSVQQTLPIGMDLLILGPGQQPVLDSLEMAPSFSRRALLEMAQTATGEFDWTLEDERYMAGYWPVLLGPRYGSPNWTVVLIEPRGDSFASLRQFGKILSLVVLLNLMIVTLLSMAQIRKSMVPLRKLQEGTERIALRRFDSKVEVDSGDEFESLADSFNAMASDLGRQFRALTTQAEIDRAILSTVDEEQIVHTILDRVADHYPGDGVAVVLADAGATHFATVHVRWAAGAICATTDHVALEPEERRRLASSPAGYMVVESSGIPDFLRELTSQGIEHCLVLPLLVRQELAGCIALGSIVHPEYREEDLQDLRRLANQAAVALSNARLFDELERTNWETLRALARAVDANSPWTAGHSERVTAMAVRLGERLGLGEDELAAIHKGGLLHDIGKIGISTEILDKPEGLSEAELAVMQSHPIVGARILEPISAYAREIPLVLHHHERFDGSGYPDGLVGEAIPLHARILAVADVFDALISERPYREPWSLERVLAYIRDGAGTQFDPQIVPVFLNMVERETVPLPHVDFAASIRGLFESQEAVHQ